MRFFSYRFLGIFAFCFLESAFHAFSQVLPKPVAENVGGSNIAGPISLMSNFEFWLTIGVMIFGAVFLFAEFLLLKNIVENKTDEILKVILVTLIVISTLILITSGFSNDQIAPALGLFGTIAGYLLGKSDAPSKKSGEADDKGK